MLTSPRDFTLKQIPAKLASELNAQWHSILPVIPWSNIVRNKHYICFGAYYNEEPYAVGIWSSPINRYLDGNTYLELRRLAIRSNSPKYTATWMLGKMIKRIKNAFKDIRILISYQDTDTHKGTIYKAGNWIPVQTKSYGDWGLSRNRSQTNKIRTKVRWEYHL